MALDSPLAIDIRVPAGKHDPLPAQSAAVEHSSVPAIGTEIQAGTAP